MPFSASNSSELASSRQIKEPKASVLMCSVDGEEYGLEIYGSMLDPLNSPDATIQQLTPGAARAKLFAKASLHGKPLQMDQL